ncbi:hypothetical protein, partial [Staphylococcus aureus]|uniref:hypothetical protein n=1 Tax=Staphylococcus aureus TaxID=1280 RepID=UPI001C82BE2B
VLKTPNFPRENFPGENFGPLSPKKGEKPGVLKPRGFKRGPLLGFLKTPKNFSPGGKIFSPGEKFFGGPLFPPKKGGKTPGGF